jgi:NodT family efflux transporter outer membrane factor (OMF) lipoprotein
MRTGGAGGSALRRSRAIFGAGCLSAALCGCAVGPDFVRPGKPEVGRYTMAQTPALMTSGAGEATQRIRLGSLISAQWWELFRSPVLSEVVRLAIAGSPTIAAARATLAEAQENVAAARGRLFPQLDVAASIQRTKTGGLTSGTASSGNVSSPSRISSLYSLGPTVSYALDVFGATRRAVEESQALAERQAYELAAAYLTLTGNAVTQALTIASLRAQIQATEDVVADDERNLSLVVQKFEAGKAARTDVLTAQTQLASDRTALPTLRQQLASARHALSTLVGRAPGEWSAPDFDLQDLKLPEDVPLSLPSELARQRPDILAAEAQLHADSAAIGVATAQLYPSITLSGSLSRDARDPSRLFDGGSTLWSLAAGLTAPVFHGGTLEAQRRAAVAAYQASLATYRLTVLQGFQQVADTLQSLAHDAELVAAERQVLDTAKAALTLQRLSYEAGKSDLLLLLVSERAYQQARLGYAGAVAQRLQDTAQLFVALGGGWWEAESWVGSLKTAP